jgi:hypothetical protein
VQTEGGTVRVGWHFVGWFAAMAVCGSAVMALLRLVLS